MADVIFFRISLTVAGLERRPGSMVGVPCVLHHMLRSRKVKFLQYASFYFKYAVKNADTNL